MKIKKIKPGHWVKFLLLVPAALFTLMCTKASFEPEMDLAPPQSQRFDTPRKSPDGRVYFIVEEMPDFQGGGQDAFRKYIAENLRYPEEAKAEGIEGRVFVQFRVKSDGSVDDARIVRGVHKSLDNEALRVILASPEWKPGRQYGKPVDVAFTFPVNFVLP